LTAKGLEFVASHSAPLDFDAIDEIVIAGKDVRLHPRLDVESRVEARESSGSMATASPDDRLESALAELRDSVAAGVLSVLASVSPAFFEATVLDLLHRMGYGASRADH
jgi:restriction system protein